MVESNNISDVTSVRSEDDSKSAPAEVITEEGIQKGEEFKQKGNDAYKSNFPFLILFLRREV